MEWRQPETLHRLYQLTRNGETVATLRFEKCGGSLATGECAQRRWTLKRTGFLSPRVLVRQVGSEVELAVFTPSWTGSGWLTFASGRRYHLRSTNFWSTEWAFEAEDGSPAVILTGPHGVFKLGGHARITEAAVSLPETSVMLLLIRYLRILMNKDAGVVVACM